MLPVLSKRTTPLHQMIVTINIINNKMFTNQPFKNNREYNCCGLGFSTMYVKIRSATQHRECSSVICVKHITLWS